MGYDYSSYARKGLSYLTGLHRYLRALRNVLLVIVGVILLGVLRGCVFRPATGYPGSHFNRGKNAVWLGIEWVNETHSQTEIAALASDLAHEQIAYVFAYTSYLKPSGDFNPTFSHAADFIQTLKATSPDLKVLAQGLRQSNLALYVCPVARLLLVKAFQWHDNHSGCELTVRV